MIFLFFLFDISTNISNKSSMVKYDLRCCFWYFIIDDKNEFDDNVKNLNAINTIDVIDVIDTIVAIKFIDVIEKLIENVIWQAICIFVIKINKCDDVIDILI